MHSLNRYLHDQARLSQEPVNYYIDDRRCKISLPKRTGKDLIRSWNLYVKQRRGKSTPKPKKTPPSADGNKAQKPTPSAAGSRRPKPTPSAAGTRRPKPPPSAAGSRHPKPPPSEAGSKRPKPPSSAAGSAVTVLEYRRQGFYTGKTSKQSSTARRGYKFRAWVPKPAGSSMLHKSMMLKSSQNILTPAQRKSFQCILCDVKKFYGRNQEELEAHYRSKHWKRTLCVQQYRCLLCKCAEMASRKRSTNRNAHIHCPICWAVLEKSDEATRHLINVHNFSLEDIDIVITKVKRK